MEHSSVIPTSVYKMYKEAHHTYLLNASQEGFETLHQQWISPLAVQHPIFCAESVSKMWHFACNLRVNPGRKCTSGTNNRETDAIKSASHQSHASQDGFEALHKQWMPLLLEQQAILVLRGCAQHLVFCAI